MNFNRDINEVKFTVYCHISPKGKRYIGITSQCVKARWLEGGKGYRDNHHFWSAIQLYGWDNFKHIIVAEGLDLKQASELESKLILEYDTMNPDFGYNQTTGGNWSKPSESTRRRISEGLRNRGPEVNAKISSSLKGHQVSEDTRRKISVANSGNHKCGSGRRSEKGRKALIDNLKGRTPWNKGLTKYTDERVAQYAKKQEKKIVTASTRKKISDVRKDKFASGYSPVWITNGIDEKLIDKKELGRYASEGYRLGRLNFLDTYIHKGDQCRKISASDLATYLESGWEQGKPAQVRENIRKSRQQYIWMFDNQEFETSETLAQYIRNKTEYTQIVSSTITNLYNKGFDTSKIYRNLSGKITRKSVVNEDQ